MQKFCVNCGTELKPSSKFCHNCGSQIGQLPALSPDSEPTLSINEQYLPLVINELKQAGPIPDYYKISMILNKIKKTDNSHRIESLQQIAYLYSKIDELHHQLGLPINSSVFPTTHSIDNTYINDSNTYTSNNSNWKKYAGMAAASFAGTFFANQVSAHTTAPLAPYTDWELLSGAANQDFNNYDLNTFLSADDANFLNSLYSFNNTSEFRDMIVNNELGDLAGDGNPLGFDTDLNIQDVPDMNLADSININDSTDIADISDISDSIDVSDAGDVLDSIFDIFS